MRLEFTRGALNDVKRLREFIAVKNPHAARRMSQALQRSLRRLIDQPRLGRLLDEELDIRELIIGDYLARYRLRGDRVTVFKIRHGKEAPDHPDRG